MVSRRRRHWLIDWQRRRLQFKILILLLPKFKNFLWNVTSELRFKTSEVTGGRWSMKPGTYMPRYVEVDWILLVDWKSDAFVLQKLLNFREPRPLFRLPTPALHHEVKHLLRAEVWRRPSRQKVEAVGVEPVLQVLNHLIVRQVGQGLLVAEGEDLPDGEAERPRVALRRP